MECGSIDGELASFRGRGEWVRLVREVKYEEV
jgi:hypothetical protein